jgi:hypothetical protein
VADRCQYSDEPSGSDATELVNVFFSHCFKNKNTGP